jgi:hypothetical protein
MERLTEPNIEPLLILDDDISRMTDQDIELLCTRFSFDTNKMMGRIDNGEGWSLNIRSHLYVEHIASLFILDNLPNHASARLPRMTFHQRISLIAAMGLLPKDLTDTIFGLNRIRNKIAHNLDYEINDTDTKDFIKIIPERIITDMVRAYDKSHWVSSDGQITLRGALIGVILSFDLRRQNIQIRRLIRQRNEYRLSTAVDAYRRSINHSEVPSSISSGRND